MRVIAELAYERSDLELKIERVGEDLRIHPAGRPIRRALDALASFSSSFLPEGRGEHLRPIGRGCEPSALYLLDTNISIYLMKQQPPQVADRFPRCRLGGLVISAITAAEAGELLYDDGYKFDDCFS